MQLDKVKRLLDLYEQGLIPIFRYSGTGAGISSSRIYNRNRAGQQSTKDDDQLASGGQLPAADQIVPTPRIRSSKGSRRSEASTVLMR